MAGDRGSEYHLGHSGDSGVPGTPDDAKLVRALTTRGIAGGSRSGDWALSGWHRRDAGSRRGAREICRVDSGKEHPGLLTLHLIALDHIEHETGPFSAESVAVMERLDAVHWEVREAAERVCAGAGDCCGGV